MQRLYNDPVFNIQYEPNANVLNFPKMLKANKFLSIKAVTQLKAEDGKVGP